MWSIFVGLCCGPGSGKPAAILRDLCLFISPSFITSLERLPHFYYSVHLHSALIDLCWLNFLPLVFALEDDLCGSCNTVTNVEKRSQEHEDWDSLFADSLFHF